jgi:hypothetical protein
MFICCLEAGFLINSKKDPQESAVKAPKMQPKALSSNESFYIYCKRSKVKEYYSIFFI